MIKITNSFLLYLYKKSCQNLRFCSHFTTSYVSFVLKIHSIISRIKSLKTRSRNFFEKIIPHRHYIVHNSIDTCNTFFLVKDPCIIFVQSYQDLLFNHIMIRGVTSQSYIDKKSSILNLFHIC